MSTPGSETGTKCPKSPWNKFTQNPSEKTGRQTPTISHPYSSIQRLLIHFSTDHERTNNYGQRSNVKMKIKTNAMT